MRAKHISQFLAWFERHDAQRQGTTDKNPPNTQNDNNQRETRTTTTNTKDDPTAPTDGTSAHADQATTNKQPTHRAKTNTNSGPTLRTNETATARNTGHGRNKRRGETKPPRTQKTNLHTTPYPAPMREAIASMYARASRPTASKATCTRGRGVALVKINNTV